MYGKPAELIPWAAEKGQPAWTLEPKLVWEKDGLRVKSVVWIDD